MNSYVKAILILIVAMMAFNLPSVHAQSDQPDMFIEPGTTIIRDPDTGVQMQGKVVIDRRTGNVWGFPTASSAPYPVAQSTKEPPISKPVYLGKFDFAAMRPR